MSPCLKREGCVARNAHGISVTTACAKPSWHALYSSPSIRSLRKVLKGAGWPPLPYLLSVTSLYPLFLFIFLPAFLSLLLLLPSSPSDLTPIASFSISFPSPSTCFLLHPLPFHSFVVHSLAPISRTTQEGERGRWVPVLPAKGASAAPGADRLFHPTSPDSCQHWRKLPTAAAPHIQVRLTHIQSRTDGLEAGSSTV